MEAPAKGVECPHCHHSNAPGTSRCAACDSSFGPVDETVMADDATMLTKRGRQLVAEHRDRRDPLTAPQCRSKRAASWPIATKS